MLGKIEGRRRGWQRMGWLDGITSSMYMSLHKLWRWRTGKPDMLQSMGLQRVSQDSNRTTTASLTFPEFQKEIQTVAYQRKKEMQKQRRSNQETIVQWLNRIPVPLWGIYITIIFEFSAGTKASAQVEGGNFMLSTRFLNIALTQFSSVAHSCPTLCDPMNHSTPGLPVYHQLPEFVHPDSRASSQWCHLAISSSVIPFSSGPNPSQHQGPFQWVNSSDEVANILEFQPQYLPFQWTPRTGLL